MKVAFFGSPAQVSLSAQPFQDELDQGSSPFGVLFFVDSPVSDNFEETLNRGDLFQLL